MGEVIRKDAAADDIAADANTTIANAAAKGGTWKQLADERLGPTMALYSTIVTDLSQVEAALMPLLAIIKATDDENDDFLAAKADEMWNLIGRPAFDAAYALVWPGGSATYADGPDDEQPDRMELLAEILTANLHPKIDAAWASALANDVQARAKAYRAHIAAAHPQRSKLSLLKRMKGVLARAVQMEIARLKRRYLAEGFTEADIHQVIPDRPRPKPAKPEALPA
jgi:hypothetical protein